jgi:hypothetical protein
MKFKILKKNERFRLSHLQPSGDWYTYSWEMNSVEETKKKAIWLVDDYEEFVSDWNKKEKAPEEFVEEFVYNGKDLSP